MRKRLLNAVTVRRALPCAILIGIGAITGPVLHAQDPPAPDLSLSLSEAIKLATHNNVQTLTAAERIFEADGDRGIESGEFDDESLGAPCLPRTSKAPRPLSVHATASMPGSVLCSLYLTLIDPPIAGGQPGGGVRGRAAAVGRPTGDHGHNPSRPSGA
jgi:hypothetical protein